MEPPEKQKPQTMSKNINAIVFDLKKKQTVRLSQRFSKHGSLPKYRSPKLYE